MHDAKHGAERDSAPTLRPGMREVEPHLPTRFGLPATASEPRHDLPPQWRYTRWRGDVSTFGIAGRIILTMVAIVAPLLWASYMGSLVWVPVGIWLVFGAPLIMRDTWGRARILARTRAGTANTSPRRR